MSDSLELTGSLFDEALQSGFGCVLFDLHDDGSEQMVAQYGKGWASINGKSAFRVTTPKELSKDVIWLTNLEQQIFWISGAVRVPSLRESEYLETDLAQIMREFGLDPKRLTSPKVAEQLSEIFSRTMKIAMDHYHFDEAPKTKLLPAIRQACMPQDESVSMEVDEAMSQSYLPIMECSKAKVDGAVKITLKRPRLAHARQVLDTALPDGAWQFMTADQLPQDKDKMEWLMAQKKPILAKVVLKGYLENAPVWASSMLKLGEAGATIGRKKERSWMTLQEMVYFSRYCKLDIKAVWMAEGWQQLPDQKGLCQMGELSDLSIALGFLAEAHWLALSAPSRHPVSGKNSMVTPRACWLKATDRFLCFASAMPLATAGFTIINYGQGEVQVLVRSEKLAQLIDLLPLCGLTANATVYEALHKINNRSAT